jgi:hypothetical protein
MAEMIFQGQKAVAPSLQQSSSAGMFLYVLFAFWVSSALSGNMELQNFLPIPACVLTRREPATSWPGLQVRTVPCEARTCPKILTQQSPLRQAPSCLLSSQPSPIFNLDPSSHSLDPPAEASLPDLHSSRRCHLRS